DYSVESGLFLDLAQQALLEALAEREMAPGQVPAPGTIRHPLGALEHDYPSAIRDYAMDPDKELRFRHWTAGYRCPPWRAPSETAGGGSTDCYALALRSWFVSLT